MDKIKAFAPWAAILLTIMLTWGAGLIERGKIKATQDAQEKSDAAQWQQIGGLSEESKDIRDRIARIEGRLDRP